MKLYHYTSPEGYIGIFRSGLKPSGLFSAPWTRRDASFGAGYYFTNLGPSYCDCCIAEACWGDISQTHKVSHYISIETVEPVASFCRDYVYLIQQWFSDHITFRDHGKKAPWRCARHVQL